VAWQPLPALPRTLTALAKAGGGELGDSPPEVVHRISSGYGDGSKPYPPVVHIKIAGIYGCSSP